jgi:3-deoxy-D-manno-octulosonate 8-phosphate phosphatase (KDO 8-P phosphatase)
MELRERFASVSILFLDVDGVLTDGRVTLDGKGGETKDFDVTDGLGLRLLQDSGVTVALITGRVSEVVAQRAKELRIAELHQGVRDKVPVFRKILLEKGLAPKNAAYVGDDLLDLPVLTRVGLAVTVPSAPEEVKSSVHYVTAKNGGRGAVREVCEEILKAKGQWDSIVKGFLGAEEP